jgi:hypothetical protein
MAFSDVAVCNINQVHLVLSTSRHDGEVAVISYNNNNLYHQRLVKDARPHNRVTLTVAASSDNFIDLGGLSSKSASTSTLGEPIPDLVVALPHPQQNPGTVQPKDVHFNSPDVHFPHIHNYWAPFPWGTESSGITNTCNFDSFPAHLIFLHRQDPTYFASVLNLFNSQPKNTIKRIIRLYSDCIPDAIALARRPHFMWQSMLLHDCSQQKTFLGTVQFQRTSAGIVNMASFTEVTVFTPLSDSSLMWCMHSCQCRELADLSLHFGNVDAANIWKVAIGVYNTAKSKKKAKSARFNSNLTTDLMWCRPPGSFTFQSMKGPDMGLAPLDCEKFWLSLVCQN